MNKNTILAVLCALSSTSYAAQNNTEQEQIHTQSIATEAHVDQSTETATHDQPTKTQNVKAFLKRYFVRENKKQTALNIAAKIGAISCVALDAYAHYLLTSWIIAGKDDQGKQVTGVCVLAAIAFCNTLTLPSIRELCNYPDAAVTKTETNIIPTETTSA